MENDKLSKEFDARVETRVQEVMSKFGTASDRLVDEGTWDGTADEHDRCHIQPSFRCIPCSQ
jgi:hypothetical protein